MQLKPFQEVGAEFLAARKRALLADDMRMGKTIQVIEACKRVGARRIRVICPAMARMVWRQHFKDYSSCSGEIVSYDEARKVERWTEVDVLVIDESHFTKNLEAQRTKAVWARGGAAWHADRIWCLSGTPAPNHVGELWPMLRAFGAIRAGYWDFVKHFCRVDSLGKIRGSDPAHVQELRDILAPFTLRRMKRDYGLAEPFIESYPVESSTDFLSARFPLDYSWRERKLYEQMAELQATLEPMSDDERLVYLEANAEHFAVLRRLTALLKAPAVADLIGFEIENGLVDKLVVFGYHRDALKMIYRELMLREPKVKAELVYGGTPDRKKEAAVRAFQRTGKGGSKVFLGNLTTAGVAIDLSVATNGILLERDWVPGNNRQALDRMSGWRQDKPVHIRDIVLPGSVDEIIARTVTRKTLELAEVFDK